MKIIHTIEFLITDVRALLLLLLLVFYCCSLFEYMSCVARLKIAKCWYIYALFLKSIQFSVHIWPIEWAFRHCFKPGSHFASIDNNVFILMNSFSWFSLCDALLLLLLYVWCGCWVKIFRQFVVYWYDTITIMFSVPLFGLGRFMLSQNISHTK